VAINFSPGVFRVTVLALALVAGAAQSAAARQSPPGGQQARPPAQRSPGEIAAMLDAYAAVQAQQALALDEARYSEFAERLKHLQAVRRRNRQARNRVVQDLRRIAGAQASPPYDEAAIRERLKALRDQDERAAAELRSAYDAVDEVLDARQQARFRLFEEMMERRELDLLMRARQRAARQGHIQP
jgi:Spy/CpxP family protein refolding chaperone